MNQRNVEALTTMILDTSRHRVDTIFARALAEGLASRGVLVPSALTVEDREAFACYDMTRDECVAELERIARGERALHREP